MLNNIILLHEICLNWTNYNILRGLFVSIEIIRCLTLSFPTDCYLLVESWVYILLVNFVIWYYVCFFCYFHLVLASTIESSLVSIVRRLRCDLQVARTHKSSSQLNSNLCIVSKFVRFAFFLYCARRASDMHYNTQITIASYSNTITICGLNVSHFFPI